MRNKAMQRKLEKGQALDVRVIGKELDPGKVYRLYDYIDDVDYCDAKRELWIWSIGKNPHGEIYAATDARYYQAEGWECLWLR